MPFRLTPDILTAALTGAEAELQRINDKIAQVRAMLGQRATAAPGAAPLRKRGMSAAGRKRISEASKRRWAEYHAQQESPAKPKRKLSAAGRRRIVEALKRRWAVKRAQEEAAAKKQAKPAKKKAAAKRSPAPVAKKTSSGKSGKPKAARQKAKPTKSKSTAPELIAAATPEIQPQ